MHSRKRGKSGSHKPLVKSVGWVRLSPGEIASLVEKLWREGYSEARIGLVLRDQYGVPSTKAVFGKSISQILSEKKLAAKYPSDLMDLIRRAARLRKHLQAFPRDKLNRKKLGDIESKIKRLVKYYAGGKLPKGWKYVPEEAALLVR